MSLFSFSEGKKEGYEALQDFEARFRDYAIASIRMEDALPIMHWRNEQMSALRQQYLLTEEEQLDYFREKVAPDFGKTKPEQILLRYTLKESLIGYGGLVHIDWESRNAEVSFLLETERTKDLRNYGMECSIFMQLLKRCAFEALDLNKINTESYANREWHVRAIEASGFRREKVLSGHVVIDGKPTDAVVASCLKEDYLLSIPD